ncbi:MAG: endonuclease domain-containing protein [Cyclobacteriaceae bacterium]|nr:endonuclease domain-containing protein [Cyclobacteriaceae bacterium]
MTYSENLFYGASPEIHRRAIELRKRMTPAEKVLWHFLKGKSVDGFKFRRQHPINKYIVDFYCHQIKLVIEVDGGIHDEIEQKEYDAGRTFALEEFGLKVIRFRNEEILYRINSVITHISRYLKFEQSINSSKDY